MFRKRQTTAQLIRFTDTNQAAIKINNLHLLPFYYFLPLDIINAHKSKRFQSIPRNPQKIMDDLELIEYIESPAFAVEIADIISAVVWYYFDIHASPNAYSVNDPIWMLTYATNWYLSALTKANYIYPTAYLFKRIDYDLPYTPWPVYHFGFIEIVPKVVEEHHLLPIIDYVKKHRCFEDFQEDRESKYKTAFINQWYHLRTKHPEFSLEELQGTYDDEKEEFPHELIDDRVDVQNEVQDTISVENFLSILSEKDKKILQLRMENYTYEEIAALIGYKTHSAVIKRIRKIGEAYQKYAGVDFGFD